MIKIDFIDEKGRGVVSTEYIKKGELIETSHIVTFSQKDRELIDKTSLFPYYFVKEDEYKLDKKNFNGHMVFGLSSFCNHSTKPNAKIEWLQDDARCNLVAIRDIKSGEEVTMFYTNIDKYSSAVEFKDNQNEAK